MTIAPEVIKDFHEPETPQEEPKLEFKLRTCVRNGKRYTHEVIQKPNPKRGHYHKKLKETFENTNRDFDAGVNTDLFWTEEDEALQQKRIGEQKRKLK
jgi:hypothetical protein